MLDLHTDYATYARTGAERLDKVKPLWWRLVDPDILDIRSSTDCALGQVFGHYLIGQVAMFGLFADNATAILEHGFNAISDEAIGQLNAAWRDEIAERQRKYGLAA